MGFWSRFRTPRQPDPTTEIRKRYTTDDYASWLSQSFGWGSFGFQGSQYPLGVQMTQPGSKTESIGTNFGGFVSHGLKGNGIVWTCESIRVEVFAQARFKWRRFNNGKPGDLFGSGALRVLEKSGLLAQAVLDVDMAGNYYGCLAEGELVRLRPDWVDMLLEPILVGNPPHPIGYRVKGYFYYEGGNRSPQNAVVLRPAEVVHWMVKPDPAACYRGMSWLTPLVREVLGDTSFTRHKSNFVDNAATPNMVVKLPPMSKEQFDLFREQMDEGHQGPQNAGSTLYIGGGADTSVVGTNFQQMDFKVVQGAGESRIAAAAGVGAVIAQFSEGMQGSSLNAGNFMAARRRFADITMRYLWQTACEAFSTVVPVPLDAELWYDDRDIPFLQEDALDAANITNVQAATVANLVKEGFTAESATAAVVSGDMTLLVHTNLVSVQLQPPGMTAPTNGSQPALVASNGGP